MKVVLLLCWAFLLAQTASAQSRQGKDYAVFFYVTDFQPGWAKLPETATEAQQLKTELATNFGFLGELVPNPTRQQILDKIKSYNDRLTANDQVLFFFSMHGYYDPASDLGYIVAADGLANDPYYTTWMDYNSLRPYFAKCKAKHVLVALDACYSGSFGNHNKSGPDRPAYAEGADCATKIGATFRYAGRQYVCSGNKDAKTPAKSLFAAKFLEGLRKGPDGDGLLYFDDLAYWLGKVKNPEPENGYFNGHQPAGDFVFVRKNACATAPPAKITPTSSASDQDLWRQAKTTHTIEVYQEYLRICGLCLYSEEAEDAIVRLIALHEYYEKKIVFEKEIDSLKKEINEIRTVGPDIQFAIRVRNIVVKPVNVLGNGKENSRPKLKNINKLIICFIARQNEGVPVGEETFYLRITDPIGAPLSIESLGSGIWTSKKGEPEFRYTTTATANYSNSEMQICAGWQPNQKFVKGKYNVEVYNKGYLVGTSVFTLK